MIDRLVTFTVTAVIGLAALWFFNDRIRDYYQKPLKEHYAEVEMLAKKQAETRANMQIKQKEDALNVRNKKIEELGVASLRLRDADKRLRDSLRASARSEVDLSACLQRSRALDNVQQTIRGFTERVVQESDRHVADKIACTDAWPK